MRISNFKFQISNQYQVKKLRNWKLRIGIIRNSLHSKAGFTLIELIVSIGVLAVLSVLVMMALNPFEQFQKSQDTKRKSDLAQIQKALESYYQDTGQYPTSNASYKIETNDAGDEEKGWGENWSPYMNIIPSDTGGREYVYVSTDGQSYYLYASLQREEKDTNSCAALGNTQSDGQTCSNVPLNAFCGGSFVCNYGVSSPNVSP